MKLEPNSAVSLMKECGLLHARKPVADLGTFQIWGLIEIN